MLEAVVSGGQTGVDRAALDAAMACGLPVSGWCPRGRLAEDGVIDDRYPLRETPSENYEQRTEWNVRDSDATLVLTVGEPEGGTAATIAFAAKHGRPCLVVAPTTENLDTVSQWMRRHGVCRLNVAGPRHSKQSEIYDQACRFLMSLFHMHRTS